MRAIEIIKRTHLIILSFGIGLGGMGIEPAHGQSGFGQDDEYNGGPDNTNDVLEGTSLNNPYGIVLTTRATPPVTGTITDAIRGSYKFCARLRDKAYLVDCLAERLEVIAKTMSKSGDYGEARKILLDTAKKMRRLAAANKSPSKPRIRATGTVRNKKITTKPLTPVRQDRVKQVNREAANLLAEAETKLLRSAQASDRRLIAYAQLAKAVGSNKTLLRSA
jgi:hypothetical protein